MTAAALYNAFYVYMLRPIWQAISIAILDFVAGWLNPIVAQERRTKNVAVARAKPSQGPGSGLANRRSEADGSQIIEEA